MKAHLEGFWLNWSFTALESTLNMSVTIEQDIRFQARSIRGEDCGFWWWDFLSQSGSAPWAERCCLERGRYLNLLFNRTNKQTSKLWKIFFAAAKAYFFRSRHLPFVGSENDNVCVNQPFPGVVELSPRQILNDECGIVVGADIQAAEMSWFLVLRISELERANNYEMLSVDFFLHRLFLPTLCPFSPTA